MCAVRRWLVIGLWAWSVCHSGPGEVEPPTLLDVGPTYMTLTWKMPTFVNGIFTGFTLTLKSREMTLYSGASTTFNVTNLTVRSTAGVNRPTGGNIDLSMSPCF